MFERPLLTEQNEIHCTSHHQIIDRVSFQISNGSTNFRFLCSQCSLREGEILRKFASQADYTRQSCVISLLDITAPSCDKDQLASDNNNCMDFLNMEVEYLIIDYKSSLCYPRNFVYLPDKSLLVACGSGGRVILWSIGEQVQFRNEFNVGTDAYFAKYINRGEHGNNYLVLGFDKLNIYEIKEDNLTLVGIIKREDYFVLYDVEWIPQTDKIVVSGIKRLAGGNIFEIWDAKTLSLEREINLEEYEINYPIMRMFYLSHKDLLAVETMSGLSLISLKTEDTKDRNPSKHFSIPDRKQFGMSYLPQSKSFILRSDLDMKVIDEDSLTLKHKYFTHTYLIGSGASQIRMNEDESQILCLNAPGPLFVYSKDQTYSMLSTNGLVNERSIGSGVIEVMGGQYRVTLGDQGAGVFYILRTNARPDSAFLIPQFLNTDNSLQNGTMGFQRRSARGRDEITRKTETSKEQLRERGTKKEEAKPKQKTKKAGKSQNKDENMEIEEQKENGGEKTATKGSRSRSKKAEQSKEDKKNTKGKAKGGKGRCEEDQEEKMNDRIKSRKGKKK